MLRLCMTVRADVGGVAKLSQAASRKGGKAVKKGDLPSKTCAECGLPITWRKKWERCWDEIRHARRAHAFTATLSWPDPASHTHGVLQVLQRAVPQREQAQA
jgi:hypothetical protein